MRPITGTPKSNLKSAPVSSSPSRAELSIMPCSDPLNISQNIAEHFVRSVSTPCLVKSCVVERCLVWFSENQIRLKVFTAMRMFSVMLRAFAHIFNIRSVGATQPQQ